MNEQYLWVEKYRPQKIDDCILPESIKRDLKQQVDAGELNNLLLTGPPGVGKTTAAKALCNELGLSYIVINGSDEGRFLDTVRRTDRVRHRRRRVPRLLRRLLTHLSCWS